MAFQIKKQCKTTIANTLPTVTIASRWLNLLVMGLGYVCNGICFPTGQCNYMPPIFRLRQFYFLPLIFLLLASLPFCFLCAKARSFQWLNSFHCSGLNNFFILFTNVGDGLVSIAAVMLFLLFKKWKQACTLLFAFVGSGLAAQLLKNFFNRPRPLPYFEKAMLYYPHFIDGVTLHGNTSFPSGHTTTAFAMATVFVLLSAKNWVSLLALLAATLVAYSRIYLGQHFLEDVLAGACIGTSFGIAGYAIFFLQKQPWTVKIGRRNNRPPYSNDNIQPVWN